MASEQSVKERPATSFKPSLAADRRNLLRGAVVTIAVLAALIAWLTTRDGGEGASKPASTETPQARIVTPAGLQ